MRSSMGYLTDLRNFQSTNATRFLGSMPIEFVKEALLDRRYGHGSLLGHCSADSNLAAGPLG